MMDVKFSKDKNSRWVDQENLIYGRWNRIKKRAQRQKHSKNRQRFVEIGPVQKEVLPSHKLWDHAYEY